MSDTDGNTVIHYAVMYGYTRIISKAQDVGLSIDIQNSKGQTPLSIAVHERKSEIIRMLIKLGAAHPTQDLRI